MWRGGGGRGGGTAATAANSSTGQKGAAQSGGLGRRVSNAAQQQHAEHTGAAVPCRAATKWEAVQDGGGAPPHGQAAGRVRVCIVGRLVEWHSVFPERLFQVIRPERHATANAQWAPRKANTVAPHHRDQYVRPCRGHTHCKTPLRQTPRNNTAERARQTTAPSLPAPPTYVNVMRVSTPTPVAAPPPRAAFPPLPVAPSAAMRSRACASASLPTSATNFWAASPMSRMTRVSDVTNPERAR